MNIHWLWRDLKNSWAFYAFFVFNLALGLAGFVALESFKVSMSEVLAGNAKEFLAADLSISARRFLSQTERQKLQNALPPESTQSEVLELFTMAQGSSAQSRLVQLKGVDSLYPFYGKVHLKSEKKFEPSLQPDSVWVYPELLTQLNLQIGQHLKIADREFTIADVILDDPTLTFRTGGLAPRVYMSLSSLKSTNLIKLGSTLSQAILIKMDGKTDAAILASKILSVVDDPGVQVTTSKQAGEDTGRMLGYLSDYLGLASLAALFLAALGAAYLFRTFLLRSVHALAIFNVLGLTVQKIFLYFVYQCLVLGFAASVLGLALGRLLLPIIITTLQELSPLKMEVSLSTHTLVVALIIGLFTSLFALFPFLIGIARIQTQQLLGEQAQLQLPFSLKDSLFFLPAIAAFWGLAFFEAHSFKTASLFCGCLLLAIIVLLLFAKAFATAFELQFKHSKIWILRQSSLAFNRQFGRMGAALVALALATLLTNLIPQLKTGLASELMSPHSAKLPALFLFDIQDEQVGPLVDFFGKKKLALSPPSALVRARILSVNGQKFEKTLESGTPRTREQESEARFRNRGFNLTSRAEPTASEKIIEGAGFNSQKSSDGIAQISVEQKFAERLGFQLGDLLKFDVQGLEITGRIHNLREVQWNSFQPNFFVVFQPGFLEDAPKTWLASVGAASPELLAGAEQGLAESFPNVSILEVGRVVEKILGLLDKMSWSLQLMAFLSLVVGLVVLASITRQQMQDRKQDLNLLKILGAGPKDLTLYFLMEFGTLSLLSSVLGCALGLGVSYGLVRFLLDGQFSVDFQLLVGTFVVCFGSSLFLAWLEVRKIAHSNPASLLRGD
jgi:putative ABC transport system permease protein